MTDREPLLAEDDVSRFRERWGDIQTRFVDEPQRAVEERRGRLHRGASDIALQRYRSFFTRFRAA